MTQGGTMGNAIGFMLVGVASLVIVLAIFAALKLFDGDDGDE